MVEIDYAAVVVKFDTILSRGLSMGLGDRSGQMCIEAALCAALDLPHGDDPGCVAEAVRSFKICLNDLNWSSSHARANGLRDLGIAQIGSKGVIDDVKFAQLLVERTIRVLIPRLFREIFQAYPDCLEAADRCEREGGQEAARDAERAARRAAGRAAGRAAEAAGDEYLTLSAKLALEVLREMKSPGYAWI